MAYLSTVFTRSHDRSKFSCSQASLDHYIQRQASADMKRRLAVVFVLEDKTAQRLKGYYSLSNESVPREMIPPDVKKKMPCYDDLPVTLLGRLAIDQAYQGKGIGESLLLDALKRCDELSKTDIGSIAVVVDPIDENARRFYEAYGFILLPHRQRLFLPMTTISKLFN